MNNPTTTAEEVGAIEEGSESSPLPTSPQEDDLQDIHPEMLQGKTIFCYYT